MELLGTGLKMFWDEAGLQLPAFHQRFPWIGADLQTVRNSFVGPQKSLKPDRRLSVPVGGNMALSLAVTLPAGTPSPLEPRRALVLVHGLGGSEDSSYMKNTATHFSRRGWTIYRMNFRGVGPSGQTSKAPYSAGLTGDMRAVLRAVAAEQNIEHICAIGFSLGGQLLLRTLGEGDTPEKLRAVVTVSAPLDLAASQRRLERRRNAFYVRYLLGNMKRDMEGISHASITTDLKDIHSVLAFDEKVIAPYFGFEGASDYYRCVSCKPLLEKINRPVLAVHSVDDPWIPVRDYHTARWPNEIAAGALLLRRGGHVGFHSASDKLAWFKNTAEVFFTHVMTEGLY